MAKIYIADTNTDTVTCLITWKWPKWWKGAKCHGNWGEHRDRPQRSGCDERVSADCTTFATPQVKFHSKSVFQRKLWQGIQPQSFLGGDYREGLSDENPTGCFWILQHITIGLWVGKGIFQPIHMKDTRIFSDKTNTGSVFNYLTNGVGCSLVELNCLTGDYQLLRSTSVSNFATIY